MEEIEKKLQELRKQWVTASDSRREIIKRQAKCLIYAKTAFLIKEPQSSLLTKSD